MTTTTAIATQEAQIRQLIADQQRAIFAKDVDQIMSRYATDIVVFDLKPPFQTEGKVAWRQVWEDCLPYFPDAFEMETRDLTIAVSKDLAVAHWLFRFIGEQNHPAMQTWMRVTTVCQNHQGNWQIAHEHLSVPFDPHTAQAAFMLNP